MISKNKDNDSFSFSKEVIKHVAKNKRIFSHYSTILRHIASETKIRNSRTRSRKHTLFFRKQPQFSPSTPKNNPNFPKKARKITPHPKNSHILQHQQKQKRIIFAKRTQT